ncbi:MULTISPECIES: MerR family transcriptional regulator [unclassified Mesorhizobium]|uniref:helix-turn-helix domain-containing protein n=1 Tax=unclassified Mesorhizobium TaxID=325217 RepID=UPI0003CE890C|nr:hypothetical protein X750_27215 [Mesorhizobium sp. LNJC394B00]
MPTPRKVLNGFTAREVAAISGLSLHMVNYLARENYLTASHATVGRRGVVRYYSYRDLVIARLLNNFSLSGIEIRRIKPAIQLLRESNMWSMADQKSPLSFVSTDGLEIFYHNANGTLTEITNKGQLAFAFVLDIEGASRSVKNEISPSKRKRFELGHYELEYATGPSPRATRR